MMGRLKTAASRKKALLILGTVCALVGLVSLAVPTPTLPPLWPVDAEVTSPASPLALLPSPTPALVATSSAEPFPVATALPTPTAETGLTPLAWLEVTAPVAYPGDMPYLAAIAVQSTKGTETVVADIRCQDVMLLQGTSGELPLPPEQTVRHFFLIPPGHTPRCQVTVAEQECGEWSIEPGGEDATSMTCVVMPDGAGK